MFLDIICLIPKEQLRAIFTTGVRQQIEWFPNYKLQVCEYSVTLITGKGWLFITVAWWYTNGLEQQTTYL